MELLILIFLLALFVSLFRVFGRDGDSYGETIQPRGWKKRSNKYKGKHA